MSKIFGPESKLALIMERITNLIVLNVIFLISCIPLITIGSSVSAMYAVMFKMHDNEEGYIIRQYIKEFKKNVKSGIILSIIFSLIGVFVYFDIYYMLIIDSGFMRITLGLILLVIGFVWTYAFPLNGRFINTIGGTIRNAFFLSLRSFFKSLFMFLINIAPIICYILGGIIFINSILFYALFGFSFSMYLNSMILKTIFTKNAA